VDARGFIRSPGNWLACFSQAPSWAGRPHGCRGSACPCS